MARETGKYLWSKTNQFYDFTTVFEMSKNHTPGLQMCNEIERILGEQCTPQEALKIACDIDNWFHPKDKSKQQPTPPPVPTCPRCGSTAITAGARGVNGFWGFIGASKTVNRCANCGNTWTPRGK